MSKTIKASIPATRKIVKGKVWTTEARVDTFEQDDAGKWTTVHPELGRFSVLEDEVIDVCRKATNWPEIKASHFPMFGFHN